MSELTNKKDLSLHLAPGLVDGYLLEASAVKDTENDISVQEALAGKQETLESGVNIKTINDQSVLGEGNIEVSGEPDVYIKNASVSGNTLTLTKKDDTTVEFTGTSDFEDLTNRPKYNGVTMDKDTDIPEVKTDDWDAKAEVDYVDSEVYKLKFGSEVSYINEIKNLNSLNPSFVPLKDSAGGTNGIYTENVIDTESPFKDILGHYTILHNKITGQNSHFRWETGNYSSAHRTNRPNKIVISFWTKISDWTGFAGTASFPLISFASSRIKLSMATLKYPSVVKGEVGNSITADITVADLFSGSCIVKKAYEKDGWCQIIYTLSDIVWSMLDTDKWMFGFSLNTTESYNFEQIIFCNTQILFDQDPLIGLYVIPDGQTVKGYPEYFYLNIKSIDSRLDNNVENLQEEIDEVDRRVTVLEGGRENILHYDKTPNSTSYILSSFNDTQDGKMSFIIDRVPKSTDSSIASNNFNYSSFALINKETGSTVFTQGKTDDICPSNFNGTYIGGNHGDSDFRTVTVNNHGKTFEDIGSIWSIGTSADRYTILAIVDANKLIMVGQNTKTYPIFGFKAVPTSGTLTHISGATHTEDMTISNAEMYQYKSAVRNADKAVIADGTVITESGDYKFNKLDIVDTYDILNPASVVEKIQDRVGTFTQNPMPMDILDADKVARHSITYRFDSAHNWKVITDFIAYQDLNIGYFGFIQQGVMSGNNCKMYIPKALPITAGDVEYDFRTIADYDSITTMNITEDYWENPELPPDRYMQYTDNLGFHSGYLFDYGVGGANKKNCVSNAFYLYNSRKVYPRGIDGKITVHAGDMYSAVAWNTYISRDKINSNGVIAVNVVEYNDKCYIYGDFNAVGIYEIEIPAKYIGKKISVFEKSNNIVLLNQMSNKHILVKVTTANPMYAYIVASIGSNNNSSSASGTGVEGNIVTFGEDGVLVDSGFSMENVENLDD